MPAEPRVPLRATSSIHAPPSAPAMPRNRGPTRRGTATRVTHGVYASACLLAHRSEDEKECGRRARGRRTEAVYVCRYIVAYIVRI
jgi:hypothetical protein